jgi:lysophospholipase L1-like esterase
VARSRLILMLSLFVATGALAAEAKRKVLFLGDGLGFGEIGQDVEPDQRFTHLLSIEDPSVDFLDLGHAGWATSTYLKRQDEAVASIPRDAVVIFIQLGANDLRLHGHSDDTVKQAVVRMDKLAERVQRQAKDAHVVILAPIRMFPDDLTERLKKAGFGPESPKYLKQLSEGYAALARRRGWTFIDLYPAVTAGSTLDGAHPNAKGHGQIAAAIWPTLNELLHADLQKRGGGKGNQR